MIVVTGATGALGRTVVADLIDSVGPDGFAIVVREPARAAGLATIGVRVHRGEYDDPAALRAAFVGADRLLFVSSPVIEEEIRVLQHQNVVAAAADAGVGHVVYTSFLGAPTSELPLAGAHVATEKAIAESALIYTFLRNSFYTEVFVNPGLTAAVTAGEITSAAGNHRLNTATREDLAHAAAAVLVGKGHDNRAYELAGPGWTFPELAEVLTEVSGTPVAHRPVELAETGPMSPIYAAILAGELQQEPRQLEALLGRPPTGLRETVRAALSA
ncbi:NmrA family NAD(P)-binding protein [Micromonospora sp. NPDC049679]|uniref:NmrA family NAD(P)-binding protein n=1 Tax=Micromonospora sp. NPDC049679 TaxID=3155920 RepID=UPI0033CC71B3